MQLMSEGFLPTPTIEAPFRKVQEATGQEIEEEGSGELTHFG